MHRSRCKMRVCQAVSSRQVFLLLAYLAAAALVVHTLRVVLYEEEARDSASRALNDSSVYRRVPQRTRMGRCAHPYGRVKIFIGMNNDTFRQHYKVAHATLQCYLRGTDYELLLVDIYRDARVLAHCDHHNDIMFRRHCALLQYIDETDWMLVLDADTGVVNPNHCIEEYIDPRVNFVFYERFFNLEVMAGNWLVRNSAFSRKVIADWANWEFRRPDLPFGTSDNCVLHMLILEHVFNNTVPQAPKICYDLWTKYSKDYDTYLGSLVFCAKAQFGALRFWPEKFKILPKGQGFARDAFLTSQQFSDRDFLYHGWKQQAIGEDNWESPFSKIPDVAKCAPNTLRGWHHRKTAKVSEFQIMQQLMGSEAQFGTEFNLSLHKVPWLIESELQDCFPNCMKV